MKLLGFESILTVKLENFFDANQDKLKDICKKFGFYSVVEIDHVDCVFECFAEDGLFDILKSRTCFLLKEIKNNGNFKIISYNIKGIIVDSYKNDEIFKL